MKLEVTKEQLELLEFMIQEFEYQDEEERALIEGIEAQIYDVKEEDLPKEKITKKFNSRLSLKPLSTEVFDDETIVSDLLEAGKESCY